MQELRPAHREADLSQAARSATLLLGVSEGLLARAPNRKCVCPPLIITEEGIHGMFAMYSGAFDTALAGAELVGADR